MSTQGWDQDQGEDPRDSTIDLPRLLDPAPAPRRPAPRRDPAPRSPASPGGPGAQDPDLAELAERIRELQALAASPSPPVARPSAPPASPGNPAGPSPVASRRRVIPADPGPAPALRGAADAGQLPEKSVRSRQDDIVSDRRAAEPGPAGANGFAPRADPVPDRSPAPQVPGGEYLGSQGYPGQEQRTAGDRAADQRAAGRGAGYRGGPVDAVSMPQDQPARGSLAELRLRLERLPAGHPSSPYDDTGALRPAPQQLRQLELPLADEERAAEPPARVSLLAATSGTGTSALARRSPSSGQGPAKTSNGVVQSAAGLAPEPAAGPDNVTRLAGPDPASAAPARTGTGSFHARSAAGDPPRAIGSPPLDSAGAGSPAGPGADPYDRAGGGDLAAGGHRADPTDAFRSDWQDRPGTTPGHGMPGNGMPGPETASSATPGNGSPGTGALSPGIPGSGSLDNGPPRSHPDDARRDSASHLRAGYGRDPSGAGQRGTGPGRAGYDQPDAADRPSADRDSGLGDTATYHVVRRDPGGRGTVLQGTIVHDTDDPGPAGQADSGYQPAVRTPAGPPTGPAGILTAEQEEIADEALDRYRSADGRNVFGGYGESGLTPAIKRVEAHLPHGGLAPDSHEHTLKSPERYKAKLARMIARHPGVPARELAAEIYDAVRYTFVFEPQHYTDGTWLVHRRLKAQGFELEARRNRWDSPEYKGIRTRWRDPAHDLAFEVQFHTPASWEVLQRTHEAYLRITDPQTQPAERAQLRARQVAAAAATRPPARSAEIGDFRADVR
jgi:hypothetical protein